MKQYLFLAIFLFIAWMCSSQAEAQNSHVFHHLKIEDGLSNNNVKAILKDQQGFLWIGTENGLSRYDGYGFKIYQRQHGKPHTLLSGDIWALQEDAAGHLWVDDGTTYALYNRAKDCFDTEVDGFLQQLGIELTTSYRLHVDKKRNLWVVQGHRVDYYRFDTQTLHTQLLAWDASLIESPCISDDGRNLYLLCRSQALYKLADGNQRCQALTMPAAKLYGGQDQQLFLYLDFHGGIWIYSYKNEDVFYLKAQGDVWQRIALSSRLTTRSNAVRCITDDGNGQVWIGTDHKGVFIYNYVNHTLTNLLNDPNSYSSLASNRINTIYCDNTGAIWLGNNKEGLSYYHENFLEFIDTQHPECGDISSMLEDGEGNIWLGTDGNGLYVKEKKRGFAVRKIDLPDIAIMNLLQDKQGRIWVGTYQDGLFCLDGGRIIHYTAQNSSLPYNSIWSLQEDRYGNLWMGNAMQTLACFNPDLGTTTSYLQPQGEDIHVMDLCYDQADKLYVGTIYGLGVMDIVTRKIDMVFGNRSHTQAFKQHFIHHVYKDRQDILWLGHKQGLTAWNLKTDSVCHFDTGHGLCDNLVKSIVQDRHGHLWFATSNGISIFKMTDSAAKPAGFSFRHLSTKDGLQNNYFNTHAVCKLSSGDLLLGTTNGYTRINPNKLNEKNRPLVKVTLTDLTIGNQPIEVDSLYKNRRVLTRILPDTPTLEIAHDDKLITIGFMAGDLLHADKIRYAYQLEGLSKEWFYTHENKVVFTTLPAGNYRLLIKACNSDGVWNHQPTLLHLQVAPPLYLHPAAWVLYVLMVCLLIAYGMYLFRKRQWAKLARQREKDQQEQALQLNEMKLKFFTNISHDLRTPLTLIISPLQMLLAEPLEPSTHKKLDVIHQNAQQLLALINSLLDFRKLDVGAETLHAASGDIVGFVREVCHTFQEYADEHSFRFSCMSEIDRLVMRFDPTKINKVLNNLLSNAFKYTPEGGEINVHLYQEDDQCCFSVADNGTGISDADKQQIFKRFYQVSQPQEKTGSGIGLHIAYEYVNLHHGSLSITDNLPQGSIFTVKLPITGDAWAGDGAETAEAACATELAALPAQAPARKSILVVDDNQDFCHFMCEFLSDEYQVYTAFNGAQALEFLQDHDVNIVVTDLMMPVMNGTELCHQIKTHMKWSHIPVILLTARMAQECQVEGYQQGADDYIVKPFDFVLLKMRIRKFIEWTEKSHQKFSQTIEVAPQEITITPLDEQFIAKAIQVVEEHMSDTDFSVEVLGESLGLSRSHLYKKLMCITGKGPADFIRLLRLKRSKQLLAQSQKQIAEIAYEVGFNSPKRFAINFKNEFGITPSEYVRSQKEGVETS